MTEAFKLTKFSECLEKFEIKCSYHNVNFFDAISPSKQPNIWHQLNLEKCNTLLKKWFFYQLAVLENNSKEIRFKINTLSGTVGK